MIEMIEYSGFTVGTRIRVIVAEPGQYHDLRQQFCVLRFPVFGPLQNVSPAIGREEDSRDNTAPYVLVVAKHATFGDVVLAGCRILDGALEPISLDSALVGSERHCELSRFTIAEGITDRGLRLRIKTELLFGINRYAFGIRQYESLYCDTRSRFAKSLKRCFGSAIEVLGPEHAEQKPGAVVPLVPFRITRQSVPKMRWRLIVALGAMHCQRLVAVSGKGRRREVVSKTPLLAA